MASTSISTSSYYALALPLLLILPLFPPTTLTQTTTLLNFAPGALPSCANTCTALYNAQDACVPPAAPVTNQAIYQSCFCQSAYLAPLYTSPAGACDQACGGADLTQIQSWYKGLCGQRAGAGAVAPVPSSSAGAGGSSSTMSTTTAGAKGTGVVGAKGTSSPSAVVQSNTANGPQGNWFGNHWRWVVMLIVLFVGLALLALASALLHRRHRRKREMRAGMVGTSSAAIEAWYPQTHSVHDLDPGSREKGKGVAGVNVMERLPRGAEEKKGRLKKGWLRGER